MHRRLGSATLSQLAFPGEGNPNFPWEKSHCNNTVVEGQKSVETNFVDFEEFCGFMTCEESVGDGLTFVSSPDVILCG